jgi:benzoyl-CoA reductase/2-hydroxyglutaryl-CoA dehydratase subunit BcrC/BadD/HgdB
MKVMTFKYDQLLANLAEQYVINCCCLVVSCDDNVLDAIFFAEENTCDIILMGNRIECPKIGIEGAVLLNETKEVKIIYVFGNSDDKIYARAIKTNIHAFNYNTLNKMNEGSLFS